MQFRIRKLYYNRNEIAMRHGKKIMDREAEWQDLKKRLAESKFRSRFRLRDAELRIIAEKGMAAVAAEFDKRENRTGTNAPTFQFMRTGYFCMDNRHCTADHLVFNRSVSLKDSFKK